MRMARLKSYMVLALSLCASFGVFAVAEDSASAASCSAAKNLQATYYTGYYAGSQPDTYEGASAMLTDRGGYVLCTTDTNGGVNFSTSWVMIQTDASHYAQSGTMYRWGYGSCVKRWAEQTPPTGSFQDFYIGGCSSPGAVNRYWEQTLYVSSGWHVRSNIDTTIIRQSTFSPFDWPNGPIGLGFASETYHYESDIPGTSTNRQDWSSMQAQRFTNDQWYGTCNEAYFGKHVDNPAWSNYAPHCDHTQAWTN
jgi:hypothetical protein